MAFQNSADNLMRLSKTGLFVCDMDGTLYLGERALEGASEFVAAAHRAGRRVVYFTNNASKDGAFYYDKLTRLGFEADMTDIVTAGDVTAEYLRANHSGARVYLIGTDALRASFEKKGITLTEGSEADIVVSSFDTELDYAKLEKGCNLIKRGAVYYCTHPDFNCPTDKGIMPDSGAIAALIAAATGVSPKFFGKPHGETAKVIEQMSGVPRDRTAVIGDRLYTDIAFGRRFGILAVLVLSGETSGEALEELTEKEPENINRPDLVFSGIGGLTKYLI